MFDWSKLSLGPVPISIDDELTVIDSFIHSFVSSNRVRWGVQPKKQHASTSRNLKIRTPGLAKPHALGPTRAATSALR